MCTLLYSFSPWNLDGQEYDLIPDPNSQACVFVSSVCCVYGMYGCVCVCRWVCACAGVCVCTCVCVYFCMIDWCCFYYFVKNSLVALLEALCARIFFFRFVNIGFFWRFVFLCVCARSLTKPFFHPSQPGSCAWLLPFFLCADCTCVLVCVCLCMWKCVGKVINV